jgi:hypothetical protein
VVERAVFPVHDEKAVLKAALRKNLCAALPPGAPAFLPSKVAPARLQGLLDPRFAQGSWHERP